MTYQETLEKADISISAAGDNTIIAAPGLGKHLRIDFLQYVPSGTVTVQLKDGTTNYGGAYPLTTGQAVTIENAIHNEHGIITLSDNLAFVMNLSTVMQVGGLVRYRIFNK